MISLACKPIDTGDLPDSNKLLLKYRRLAPIQNEWRYYLNLATNTT